MKGAVFDAVLAAAQGQPLVFAVAFRGGRIVGVDGAVAQRALPAANRNGLLCRCMAIGEQQALDDEVLAFDEQRGGAGEDHSAGRRGAHQDRPFGAALAAPLENLIAIVAVGDDQHIAGCGGGQGLGDDIGRRRRLGPDRTRQHGGEQGGKREDRQGTAEQGRMEANGGSVHSSLRAAFASAGLSVMRISIPALARAFILRSSFTVQMATA